VLEVITASLAMDSSAIKMGNLLYFPVGFTGNFGRLPMCSSFVRIYEQYRKIAINITTKTRAYLFRKLRVVFRLRTEQAAACNPDTTPA